MNARKIDIRLPGKGNSTSHGARTVHQKHRWIRTSRLSIKNSLSLCRRRHGEPHTVSERSGDTFKYFKGSYMNIMDIMRYGELRLSCAASERSGDTFKYFKGFYMNIKAGI